MGKYADPTVNLVDKTYENLAKGVVEGSKGIAAGMKAFQEREAKKAKDLADKISGITGQYDKATADYLKKAQTILDNGEFDQSDINRINGQLNQAFYDGKNRLKNLIASGASQAEIDAALQKEITGAQSFGVGVAAMGEIGKATVKAEATAMKNDGKDGGSVLVNQPEYVQSLADFGNDQLSSFTVVKKPYDPNDPNASNWNYDFRIDKNEDGEYTDDEIINIPKMGKNFEKGTAYFYTMPDDKMLFPPNDIKNMLSEDSGINSDVFKTTGIEVSQDGSIVTTTTKTQLDPDLVRANLYAGKDDENYSGSISQQVDTIIESFDGNKPGWQTYYQKFYGAKALADYMDKASKLDPKSEEAAALEAEAKEMVKNEYISRKIIPGLNKGEINIKPRLLTTSTSVNIKENKGRQNLIRTELKTFVPKAQAIYTNHDAANPDATAQSLETLLVGSHYGDAPGTVQKVLPGQYTQGGGGAVTPIAGTNDGNTFTIITKSGNQTNIAKVIDITDGNYTENITKPYIEGDKDYNADDKAFGNHLLSKGLDDDTYQGATSTTSRRQNIQGGNQSVDVEAEDDQTSTIAKKVNPPVVTPNANQNQNQQGGGGASSLSGQVSDDDDDDYVANRTLYMSQPQDTRAYGIDDDGNEISFEKDSEEFLRNIEVTYGGYEDGGTKGLPSYGGNDKRIDQHLNSKNEIGEYFDGSVKKGLKADIGEDVYNGLSDANKAILRMEHLNVGWNPKVIMLQTAGIISDAERGAYHRGDKDVNALYEKHKNTIASKLKGKDAQLLKNLESTYKGTQNHGHNDQTAKLVNDFNKGKDSKGKLIPLTYKELGELAKKDTKKGKAAKIAYDKITEEGKKRDKGYQAQYTRRIADIKKHYQIK